MELNSLKKLFFIFIFVLTSNCFKIEIKENNFYKEIKSFKINRENETGTILVNADSKSILIESNINQNSIKSIIKNICNNYTTECLTDSLEITGGLLNYFPMDLLNDYFQGLKQLNFSLNKITKLATFNKNSFKSIESIDLSSNLIDTIESFNLKSLKYLNLANNQIQNIDLFTFSSDIYDLIELDLCFNQINETSIEFLSFAHFPNLKMLKLDNNRLQQFPNHLMLKLYSLEYLSIKANNLKIFDLFGFNKNNEYLKYIDLSFNRELKFSSDNDLNDNINNEETNSNDKLENLNLSHIDLSSLNMNTFLDNLFDNFKWLKSLNLSTSNLKKTIWSVKWPKTIETIDLSNNLLKDGHFDCRQFMKTNVNSIMVNLKSIYLNNNRLSNFDKFITSCSSILNKLNHGVKFNSLTIDLRNNYFKSLESIKSTTNEKSIDQCKYEPFKSSLILSGNPLICNCDLNWWSSISSSYAPNLFYVKDEYCLFIEDYDSMSCRSNEIGTESFPVVEYKPIRNHLITSNLICPYRYTCSMQNCECCEFRACDCAFHCPVGCQCARDYPHTYDLVNCTATNLTTLPVFIPTTTTELLLNNNNLRKIQPYQFFGRFKILTIDLSFNLISFIEENTFHGLNQLNQLNLSHNNLQILLGYEFKDLYQLEYLSLANNRLQFISNSTFLYIINLKYLNLKNNLLRHILEVNVYFKFNVKLNNLSLDLNSNQLGSNLLTEFLIKNKSDVNDYYDAEKSSENSSVVSFYSSKPQQSNLTYLNLIRSLLGSNLGHNEVLFECIFEKFKSITNSNRLIKINDKINNQTSRLILSRRIKFLKLSCLRDEDGKFDIKFFDSYFLKSKIDPKNTHDLNTFIILNYTTIFWCSLIVLIILLLFLIVFGVLLIKLKQKKKKFTRNDYSGAERVLTASESSTISTDTILSNEITCYSQLTQLFFSIRKKFQKLLIKKENSLFPNTQLILNHQAIVDYNDEKCSNIQYSSNTSTKTSYKLKNCYDMFIVYNKLDADLVVNVIKPILEGNPYNFAIKLQHSNEYLDQYSEKSSILSTYSSNISDSNCDNEEILLDYINSSSIVLFILSKNLFTDVEYKLSEQTPRFKKLAVIADDISESIAEEILKPRKILKGMVNFDKMVFSFISANNSGSSFLMSREEFFANFNNEINLNKSNFRHRIDL